MTIQDIQYILAIMEAGSINKASEKLFVSQPSLSKCLKRVEQEYHIFLFTRSQGSALAITDIGRIFQTFAQEVLRSHDHLVNQIQILQHHRKNSIVLGTTMKRSYDLAGPLLRWIYIVSAD